MSLIHYPELNLGFVDVEKNATTSIKALPRQRRTVTLAEFLALPRPFGANGMQHERNAANMQNHSTLL